VAAEVKYYRDPLSAHRLLQFLRATDSEEWSRRLLELQSPVEEHTAVKVHRILISQSGFRPSALRAAADWLGRVDLLSPADLRTWIAKRLSSDLDDPDVARVDFIVRAAMLKIARVLAAYPEELRKVEWRDLERVLREVFEGLNFETRLTRSAKDGGFDLELRSSSKKYLVEVKHWLTNKVGSEVLKQFVQVVAREKSDAGLVLSTDGYTKSATTGIVSSEPVHLGSGMKIIALCKAFVRARTELWTPLSLPEELLFEGTTRLDISTAVKWAT
jgi:hypothetical protein